MIIDTLNSYRYLNPINKEKALLWCITIAIGTMLLEFIFSYLSNSLMLFSDGVHMFTHALSLIVTLISIVIAKKTKNKVAELIAVTINGMTLFYLGIYIMFESFERLVEPAAINLNYTVSIALIGLLVNLLTAVLLYLSGLEDLSTKSAFTHMMADTFMSISIIVGAAIIYATGLFIIDPLLSGLVSILVMKWAFDLFKQLAEVLNISEALGLGFKEKINS